MRKQATLVAMTLVVVCVSYLVAHGEYRTWTANGGLHTTLAEFVELKPDGMVALRKKDGPVINVPLDKLSDADKAFVRQATGTTPSTGTKSSTAATPQPVVDPKQPKKSEADATRALKAVVAEAEECRTADEAALLLTMFLSDGSIPDSVRTAAQEKAAEWQGMVDKGLVRLGRKWCTVDEVRNARVQASFLINQGLEMVRLSQDRIALEKLLEASKTDPDGIQADFVIATVYALAARNFDKANQHYEVCLRRDPQNVAVLNNLALVEIRLGQQAEAVQHWKKAAGIRYDQRLAQNIGRLLDQAGKRKIMVPPSVLSQLSDVYASMVVTNKVFGADKHRGWQYLLVPIDSLEEAAADPSLAASAASGSPDEMIPIGSGAGFVVFGNYILTNRNFTKGASDFQVSNPNDKGSMLPATLVASSKDSDLAVLKCDALNCPPLPIDDDLVFRVGSEVCVTSFGLSDVMGMNVKSTHGNIMFPPSTSAWNMVQYNATDPGRGGGPVSDSMGNVVAIHCKGFDASAVHYCAGIPMVRAKHFLQESIEGFQPTPRNKADQPWGQIEQQAAKSTVSVVARGKAQDVGLSKRLGDGYLQDNSCVFCNGKTKVKCPAPGCSRGTVPRQQTVASTEPISGRRITETQTIRVPCSHCHGSGTVTCPDCHGSGIDRSLVSGR